ncbi:MAG: HTH domain-containing protein [Selenomonadaceae bacterium]|nr:HTH domain-containing protein [Selenomonadaceae bacterium]
MIDYKNELGPLLTKVLKIIKESKEPIICDELARMMNVSNRIATNYLEALYNRGYIMDARSDWKDKQSKELIFEVEESRWIVSADGLNYLDLHNYWWTRFWVRSILCPLIVSALVSVVTSLNAEAIRGAILAVFNLWTR